MLKDLGDSEPRLWEGYDYRDGTKHRWRRRAPTKFDGPDGPVQSSQPGHQPMALSSDNSDAESPSRRDKARKMAQKHGRELFSPTHRTNNHSASPRSKKSSAFPGKPDSQAAAVEPMGCELCDCRCYRPNGFLLNRCDTCAHGKALHTVPHGKITGKAAVKAISGQIVQDGAEESLLVLLDAAQAEEDAREREHKRNRELIQARIKLLEEEEKQREEERQAALRAERDAKLLAEAEAELVAQEAAEAQRREKEAEARKKLLEEEEKQREEERQAALQAERDAKLLAEAEAKLAAQEAAEAQRREKEAEARKKLLEKEEKQREEERQAALRAERDAKLLAEAEAKLAAQEAAEAQRREKEAEARKKLLEKEEKQREEERQAALRAERDAKLLAEAEAKLAAQEAAQAAESRKIADAAKAAADAAKESQRKQEEAQSNHDAAERRSHLMTLRQQQQAVALAHVERDMARAAEQQAKEDEKAPHLTQARLDQASQQHEQQAPPFSNSSDATLARDAPLRNHKPAAWLQEMYDSQELTAMMNSGMSQSDVDDSESDSDSDDWGHIAISQSGFGEANATVDILYAAHRSAHAAGHLAPHGSHHDPTRPPSGSRREKLKQTQALIHHHRTESEMSQLSVASAPGGTSASEHDSIVPSHTTKNQGRFQKRRASISSHESTSTASGGRHFLPKEKPSHTPDIVLKRFTSAEANAARGDDGDNEPPLLQASLAKKWQSEVGQFLGSGPQGLPSVGEV